jgi:hypothetical protein
MYCLRRPAQRERGRLAARTGCEVGLPPDGAGQAEIAARGPRRHKRSGQADETETEEREEQP